MNKKLHPSKKRKTRSVKLSDAAWERLGRVAALSGRTRGDLLEVLFSVERVLLERDIRDISKDFDRQKLINKSSWELLKTLTH